MTKITYKKIQYFLVLITFLVFFSSLYFQYVLGLQPCPLCLMQRICVFVLLALMGISLGTMRKAHFICLLHILVACAGLYFSLRQLWLQSLPVGQAPACMPGLDILIRYFPWQTIAKALFWGSGDCAEDLWHMLGISMPGWAALYFFFMIVMGFVLYLGTRRTEQ